MPRVGRSPDPTFGFLLSVSEVGRAGYLATGDKCGVLALAHYQATRIVSARDCAVSIVESLQSADHFTAQRVLPPGRLVESSESA